jgi:hypothetical protein
MSVDGHQMRCTERKYNRSVRILAVVASGVALAGAIVLGCSSNTSPANTATGMATASVMVSDPSTCQAPNGPYAHVYVTVADVRAHVNANAGDADAGWVDLTPKLSAAPQQIDLLGLANNQCFLASLGDPLELQPGNYQQLRVILADNLATVGGKGLNACTSTANCVVLNDGSTYPLQLSSESKTGIKIPLGQIANGGFNVAAGQTKELDIDFNTCISIVQEGNGKYRLKPVLHAGEVSTTSSSINGVVVDSATGKQITGEVTVALEQKDANGIDRVFMNTLTDASGAFVFCPLPAGTYDVVVVGTSSAGVVYSPTVITGVTTGSALSTVQLHALPVVSVGGAGLQGLVTSQNAANPPAGTATHVQLSALEAVSGSLTVTVPLVPSFSQSWVTLTVATANGSTCSAGTYCAGYTMTLPAGPAFVGAFAAGGTVLTQGAAASYKVDGIAVVPSSGGLPDCSTSELTSVAVVPVAGTTIPVSTLAFTGCQ